MSDHNFRNQQIVQMSGETHDLRMSMPGSNACSLCNESEEVLYASSHFKIVWGAGTRATALKVGHVMVVSLRHIPDISKLMPEEQLNLVQTISLATRASYSAWFESSSWPILNIGSSASCNIGFNHGPYGGDVLGPQCEHFHVHVLPRTVLDTNFMWWTTQASILHLKDFAVKDTFRKILHGSEEAGSRDGVLMPTFDSDVPAEDDCPLCKEKDTLSSNEAGRVLFSTKPYKYGHVMVVPWRHLATLGHCTDSEAIGLMALLQQATQMASKISGADSYSVGINVGPHSGASIPSHLHIHVVPRFREDSSICYWQGAEKQHGQLYAPDSVRDFFRKHYGSAMLTK